MANSSSRKIWRSSFFVVLLAALAALCAPAARAQTPTLVTGTIVGTDGVPWTGAQLTGVLIYAGGGGSPRLTPCTNNTSGCPIQQQVPPTTLGPGGTIQGLSLYPNANILPAASTYTFTVTTNGVPPPLGTGPQTCTDAGVTIAGATQTLTITGCPALSNIVGTGVGNGASPLVGWYLGPNCPTANTGQCYNTPANGQTDITCNWNAIAAVVNCPDGPFTAGDLTTPAKLLWGCASFNPSQAYSATTGLCGSILTATHVTITAVNSSTQVAISAIPTNACAANCAIYWGTPDDTGATAFEAAYDAALSCPRVTLQGGYYTFTTFHFNSQPTACGKLPSILNPSAATEGYTDFASALFFEGRGPGATVWWLPPDFPESGTCNFTPSGGTVPTCFAVPGGAHYKEFSIQGGTGGGPSGVDVIDSDMGTLEYFNCFGVFMNNGAARGGVLVSHWSQMFWINVEACGANGFEIDATTGAAANTFYAKCIRCASENAQQSGIGGADFLGDGGSTWICQDCIAEGGYESSGGCFVYGWRNITNLTLLHPTFYALNNPCQLDGIANSTTLYLDGLTSTGNTCPQNFYVLDNRATGGKYYVRNSQLNACLAGNSYVDQAGVTLIDQGGNSGFGTGGGATANGSIVGELNSGGATTVTAAKLVLSAGWGSTAAWTALSGGDSPIQGTITNSGTGQGASPTITYTFPTPLIVSPYTCTATQIGGTNPTGTFTTSALSKTGATFTFSLTPTASDTEIVNVSCVAP